MTRAGRVELSSGFSFLSPMGSSAPESSSYFVPVLFRGVLSSTANSEVRVMVLLPGI